MTESLAALGTRRIDPARTAIFLDFDGTLVEIAEHPDLVRLLPATRDALTEVSASLGGALAVVTGRDISDVDRFLHPLHLPVAGVHGLRRRSADGSLSGRALDGKAVAELEGRLRSFVNGSPGLFVERKTASIALHYRARPELEEDCVAAVDAAAQDLEGVHLVRGKMVIEAKAGASDKGGAVAEFLAEPPFAGRLPLFAGDDVTDEDAFALVNARGGISVKVGPGPTRARYRADDIAEFLCWLRDMADHLKEARDVEQP